MKDIRPASLRRTRVDESLLPPGAVLIDQTRERTSWDEGMFVTSAHFNRDQSYVIARQSDLGQAIGAGVVEGLEVTQEDDDPTAVFVQPGLGIAGGGDSIVVHNPVRISLSDIALQKSLTQSAGLLESLKLVSESRSGLFVLCATPVEYSSNPVGSYATSADGQRKLRDSVVNEATLFTLVPFALSTGADAPEARRAIAARRVFLDGAVPDIPPSSLPLAMMELDGNVLAWLDMHMARRLAGAARADAFGLGFVDTATRIAHFEQYDALIQQMITASPGLGFAASDRFDILPPMGRMPAASVAPRAPAPGQTPVLSHNWVPAEMPVEMTVLTRDEREQLLEESLTMPPIDLHARPEVLAQTPITIIVEIPREDWLKAPTEVVQKSMSLRAAAPLGKPATTPLELIQSLLEQDRDQDLIEPTDDAAWRTLLSGKVTLWYMRRRQFLRTDALTGKASPFRSERQSEPLPLPDPGDGGGTPIPDPSDSSGISPDEVNGLVDLSSEAVRRQLEDYGLHIRYRDLKHEPDLQGMVGRLAMNSVLLEFLRRGSTLIPAHLLLQGREKALSRDFVSELIGAVEGQRVETDFIPFEGYLIGGSLDFLVPQFEERGDPPRIRDSLSTGANEGQQTRPGPSFPVPPDMVIRVEELLEHMDVPNEQIELFLARGGGAIANFKPRDIDFAVRMFSRALDLGVPVIARPRSPGSIEMQTRRNLVARTGLLPELIKRITEGNRFALTDAVSVHLQTMDRSLIMSNANEATELVTRSLKEILEA